MNLTRRECLTWLPVLVAAVPLVVHGQASGRPKRVGIISSTFESAFAPYFRVIKEELRGDGWIEGAQVEYLPRYGQGDPTRYDALARDLVAQRADVIFATSPLAVRAVQAVTGTVPIVGLIGDPAQTGMGGSLAHPGGNLTGVSNIAEELLPKLLEFLRSFLPKARRVAFVTSDTPTSLAAWGVLQGAARQLRMTVLRYPVNQRADLSELASAVARDHCEAVVVSTDAIFFAMKEDLSSTLQPTALPVGYIWREHVVLGGLFSYGPNLSDNVRQAARLMSKILRGSKAGDLPVVQSQSFDLVINGRVARTLGITIPADLRVQAAEILE